MRRGACAFVGLAVLLAAPGADAATKITASPALFPKFSSKVTDYVSRCHSGRKLRLSLRPGAGARVGLGTWKPNARKRTVALSRRGGQNVTIKVVKGKSRSTYHVRCLQRDFLTWTAHRHAQTQAGFYITAPGEGATGSPFVVIFDNHGVPVWWMRPGYKPIDAKLLPDGNLAWSEFRGASFALAPNRYEERRLNGSLVRHIHAIGANTDFHDLQVIANGDYLLLSYEPRDTPVDLTPYGGPSNATVFDGVAQEVTPSGKLVWSWNSKDHVATNESTPRMQTILSMPAKLSDGRTAYDIVHINSIAQDGDGFLLSMPFTDAIYKVSRATGAIEWKLGGTHTGVSLTVPGLPSGSLLFGSQHDARVLSDGTVTVHDNRTLSTVAPRAVRFRINEAARTATLIEQVTDPRIPPSICCGSARKLPGGNWVASWGFSRSVEEITPKGKVVFGLRFPAGVSSYRAVPVLAKQLSIAKLRAGMDAMYGSR